MKKIKIVLALLCCFILLSGFSPKKSNLSEIEKFEIISSKIDKKLGLNKTIDESYLNKLFNDFNIQKFNYETNNNYTKESLIFDILDSINQVTTSRITLSSNRPVYEGKLNKYSKNFWNYTRVWLNQETAKETKYLAEKTKLDLERTGVISTGVIALINQAGGLITGIVIANQIYNYGVLIIEIDNKNNYYGISVDRNKYTGAYTVWKQVNNRCIDYCEGGSSGGWSLPNDSIY